MSYKLYIDDIRTPVDKDNWVIARSYNEAIRIIEEYGCPIFISFDHDLGVTKAVVYNDCSGLDIAKWLVEQDLIKDIIPENFDFGVHSANPIGAKNIESYLRQYLDLRKFL